MERDSGEICFFGMELGDEVQGIAMIREDDMLGFMNGMQQAMKEQE